MAVFQLIAATINIAGSRDHTVYRDGAEAITYPEMLVLQSVHGGPEHVHGATVVGHVEREHADERERLMLMYPKDSVVAVFPGAAHMPLPLGDDSIPTAEEAAAVAKASEEARAKARSGRATKPGKSADVPVADQTSVIPDLTAAKK